MYLRIMKIYMNDGLVDQSAAMVSVFDHRLLYGDGIFEGIRLYDGCIFSWMRIWSVWNIRLKRSCSNAMVTG